MNALSGPTSVAVDPASHDVYVADPANERIDLFDPDGTLIKPCGEGEYGGTGGAVFVAVGPDGELLVADSRSATAKIRLREYEPGCGAKVREKSEVVGDQENLAGFAVDSTGDPLRVRCGRKGKKHKKKSRGHSRHTSRANAWRGGPRSTALLGRRLR